eukprot:gene26247-32792_t
MGKDTNLGRAILASNIDLDAPKHIFLMVFMLVDRKDPHSFFRPYYDILPATLSNMPIFWNETELRGLEGSYLLHQIEERNKEIEADYLAICSVVPEFEHIATLMEFKWARMCVCSRNFGLVINGLQTAALVPYADMLNHYRPRESKWQFDDTLQSFTVVSLQGISAGSQVYDSYGRKCNHRFLLNYGFSVENNVEVDGFCPNEVPIVVELFKTDPLFDIKVSYYRRDLNPPHRRVRVCVSDNENTKLLFSLLRIVEADREDFDLLAASTGSGLYRSIRDAQVAVSLGNERRAMTLLRSICDEYLAQYPTTLEQDCERLLHGDVPVFSNERHALIQVRGEKEVLHFFRDFALVALRLLQSNGVASAGQGQSEFETLLEEVRQNHDPLVFQYCRGTIGRLMQNEDRRREVAVSAARTPMDDQCTRSLESLMRIIQQNGMI